MPGKRKWTSKWRDAVAAAKDGYALEYSGEPVTSSHCRHCHNHLNLNRVQPPKDGGVVFVQPCACAAGANIINLDRFRSIFPEGKAIAFYDALKQRKQRNWTTAGLDVCSLNAFVARYGQVEGERRFHDNVKKTTTTSLDYFKARGLSDVEATLALKTRQGTRALDAAFMRDGKTGIEKWIKVNAAWRQKLDKHPTKESSIEPGLIFYAEQKAQYWWLVTVLTDLSKRLGQIHVEKGHQLDHKFSRTAAFHLGINPKIICAEPNLRSIEAAVNLAKKDLCSITRYNLEQAYEDFLGTERGKLYNNISETLLDCIGYQWSGW